MDKTRYTTRYCGLLTECHWFGEVLTRITAIRTLLKHNSCYQLQTRKYLNRNKIELVKFKFGKSLPLWRLWLSRHSLWWLSSYGVWLRGHLQTFTDISDESFYVHLLARRMNTETVRSSGCATKLHGATFQ
jgi:hypothetical protein